MALRAKKPELVEKRFKALFYGIAGAGKTTVCMNFPSPYIIDCERGTEQDEYVEKINEVGGAVFQTSDFDELFKEVKSLLTEKHDYKTLVIDPLTIVYNELLDRSAKSLATKEDPEGMAFGRHKAKADRQVKALLNLLLRLDMNVIITSHAKKVWGAGMVDLGNTFDCYAKLDYLFDLVVEVQKRGKQRFGLVVKSRLKNFEEGSQFPFSYDEIATRYGSDILTKEANNQTLATPEQLTRLKELIELLKIPSETSDKWLDKAGALTFEDMETSFAAKIIEAMENKFNNKPTQEAA